MEGEQIKIQSEGKFQAFLKKYWKWLGLVVFIILISVAAWIYFQKEKSTEDSTSDLVEAAQIISQSEASLILIDGFVEVDKNGLDQWVTATLDQILVAGDLVRVGAESSAVLMFASEDLLVINQNSSVRVETLSSAEIVVDQIYGSTYSSVVKKDSQTFSIKKDATKVTALGTEFAVELSDDGKTVNVYVYKSKVVLTYGESSVEIEESNQLSYDSTIEKYTSGLMEQTRLEANQPYLGLLERARETIMVKKAEIASSQAAAENSSSNSSDSSSSSSNAGNSSNQGASGNSGNSGTTTSVAASSSSSSSSSSSASSIHGSYSATSIESIVNSLQLVYSDAANDYNNPGGGAPPSGVYDYAPVDTRNIYMGIRNGRLYIKWTLGGAIPSTQQTIGSDKIETLSYTIAVDTDGNTSNSILGAETMLQINIAYHDDGQIWYNPWFNAGWISGTDEHSAVYTSTGNGLAHTYNSGLGKSSVVFSYALADLAGGINIGSNLKFDIWSEAESNNWHHYSFDQAGSGGGRVWADWTAAAI